MKHHRIEPGPNQESVWDYPRPPCLEPFSGHIKIILNGVTIAETRNSIRVLETSHPPCYYIPPEDICYEYLFKCPGISFCEWKGVAHYYNIIVGQKRALKAAWYYSQTTPEYSEIKDYVAFYPNLFDGCYVNNEKVQPQPGGFYGGWVTSNIVGPFKGTPGTEFW